MLDGLAADFEICVAADAAVCNAAACSAALDASPTDPFPALHLPYIMEQTPVSPKGSKEIKWEFPKLPLHDEKEDQSSPKAASPSAVARSRKSDTGNGSTPRQLRPKTKAQPWFATLGSKLKEDAVPADVRCGEEKVLDQGCDLFDLDGAQEECDSSCTNKQ
eukprot:407717-Amphidinium_carterae.1